MLHFQWRQSQIFGGKNLQVSLHIPFFTQFLRILRAIRGHSFISSSSEEFDESKENSSLQNFWTWKRIRIANIEIKCR